MEWCRKNFVHKMPNSRIRFRVISRTGDSYFLQRSLRKRIWDISRILLCLFHGISCQGGHPVKQSDVHGIFGGDFHVAIRCILLTCSARISLTCSIKSFFSGSLLMSESLNRGSRAIVTAEVGFQTESMKLWNVCSTCWLDLFWLLSENCCQASH